MSSNNSKPQQLSLLASHAEYVKGAAESTIGSATGSEALKDAGEYDKAHAVSAMKAASENRDASQGLGRVEELAGKATGCAGMQKEGAASKSESSHQHVATFPGRRDER